MEKFGEVESADKDDVYRLMHYFHSRIYHEKVYILLWVNIWLYQLLRVKCSKGNHPTLTTLLTLLPKQGNRKVCLFPTHSIVKLVACLLSYVITNYAQQLNTIPIPGFTTDHNIKIMPALLAPFHFHSSVSFRGVGLRYVKATWKIRGKLYNLYNYIVPLCHPRPISNKTCSTHSPGLLSFSPALLELLRRQRVGILCNLPRFYLRQCVNSRKCIPSLNVVIIGLESFLCCTFKLYEILITNKNVIIIHNGTIFSLPSKNHPQVPDTIHEQK